ncbi:Starch-binding associating with outer membrane [Bacteroides luti]|uniref:Starch-binding associating with outer membrane n=1 Tax=Bacteroides luti TaxID=1297750 RepID=A0A1M5G806_9BACE|nr:SusD/RagB family nutrient-binding outer membrane lipoprotein [Bacteroides luti]SHF99571.1 Starch-binding associating with outer membrane [Bacteroides luti]
MKSIFKFNISKGLLSAAMLSAVLASCSEDVMDNINKDANHTTNAPSKFILADVITSTAFNNVGGDLNTYFSAYVENEVGTYNQLYNAEIRQNEPSASSTFNNVWGNIYSSLKNARIVIKKCSEGGEQEGNYTTKGMAEVMAALNSAILTDAYGDVPYTQAALPDLTNGKPQYMNPEIDSQENVYKTIMQLLDNAIVDLPQGDKTAPGSFDLLYSGDKAKWLKLAYGLKARYTMRLMKRSTNVAADMAKVIEYVDKSFASVDDQAAFDHYSASNLNPLFDFQWSRDAISASQSMYDKLAARKDPRISRVYYNPSSWAHLVPGNAKFRLAPNGTPTERQNYYSYSVYVYAQLAPTMLMSYHELLFLKAEALCRLNRANEAEGVLKQAVVAAIANTEKSVTAAMNAPTVLGYGGLQDISADAITTAQAETYFETNVKPLFAVNALKEVMNQKYIALWGASGEATESYNDIRRMKALGENYVTLANTGKFPLRCPYGSDDTLANPNVKKAYGDGQYVYTEPVWWAGGTR